MDAPWLPSDPEPAPRMRFEDLPQEMQEAYLARQRDEAARDEARIIRIKRRAKMAALGGGVTSLFLSFFLGSSGILFYLAIGAFGAAAAWAIAAFRLGQTLGSVIFGVGMFAFVIVGAGCGWLEMNVLLVFFDLLLYVVTGSLVAFAVEEERSVTESF
jgi:hypothetical protein